MYLPLVSICIPLYNKVEHIERTIKLALNQTYSNIEIIISDNASNDGSEIIARSYQSIDSRIKYYRLEHTIPPHSNWQYAIRLAQGEFVHLLCADDWIESNFIEEMIQPLRSNPDLDLTVCQVKPLYEFDAPSEFVVGIERYFDMVNGFNQKIVSLKDSSEKNALIALLCSTANYLGPMVSVLFRRSCCLTEYWKSPFGKIDCKSLHPDWDMLIRLHLKHKGAYLDTPLAKFSFNSGGFALQIDSIPGYSLIDLVGKFLSPFVFLSDPYLTDLRLSLSAHELSNLKKLTHHSLDNIINAAAIIDSNTANSIYTNSLNPSQGDRDRQHILLYTDDHGTYGVAQHSHAMMKGFIENGYQVTCVQGRDRHHLIDERTSLGIQHVWLESTDFSHGLNNDAEAKRLLQQIDPDLVVFSNCCPISNYAAKRVAIDLNIPYIVVEGSAGEYLADRFYAYLPELKQHYQQARQVISVSTENLQNLHRRFGLPVNRGQVIYLGKPPQYFQPIDSTNRDRLRQELNIPDRAIVCFTTARIDGAKGHNYQMEAIAQLKDLPIWENLYFVWAGDGDATSELQQMIIDLGVTDRVKLLGVRSDIDICLDMADIFILPSEYEGMPHAIMEAMAKGLPVIASRVGGIPEELGDTGQLLTDPKINSQQTISELVETIQLWVTNSDLRKQIGIACKQRAIDLFQLDRMIEQTIEVVKHGLSTDDLEDNPERYSSLSELKKYIEEYQLEPSNLVYRDRLLDIRQKLVDTWLNLSLPELEIAYQGLLGQQHKLLILNGLLTNNYELEQEIETNINLGFDRPQSINYLLCGMLYQPASEFSITCDLMSIPDWLRLDYLEYLLTPPRIFTRIGEIDRYNRYLIVWIDYLHEQILSHPDDRIWQKVAEIVTSRLNCLSLYDSPHNLKNTYRQRAEIIEFQLNSQGHQLDYEFTDRDPERSKIRIGILAAQYAPHSETFNTLPFYKYLNREVFEVVLYTLNDSNHRLNRYCAGHVDAMVVLPQDLSGQVQTIRSDDLDLLLIATNITAVTNSATQLVIHRLARIQCVTNSSFVTTGMKNIDYYFSGELTELNRDVQSHYTEKLLCINGAAHYRDRATEANLSATIAIDRQSLGLTDRDLVYISGASFFSITPELELVWAQILRQQPQAKLVLYPFDPEWNKNYPIDAFKQRIRSTFDRAGIELDRLIILNSAANFADIKARLAIANVYLDSFPFSNYNSLLDALEVSLPVVVYNSCSFINSSLLRSLDITDLLTDSEESYIQLAIELGQNSELRQQKMQQIESRIQDDPICLDSRAFSAKIGNLFQELFDKYNVGILNQNLRLRDINLMIFPDWNQSEELVGSELQQVIQTLATQSKNQQTTLIIDTTDIAVEDAEMFLSSITMNLMMEEDLDITEELEISLVEDLNDIQWATLIPSINARIVLECDNQAAIGKLSLAKLSQLELESFIGAAR
jgi:predicted O-linked N-acetylglucosamine transferase (SPINDLY family)/glycosyltransferase involved in cell wall biosynthesis